MNVGRSINMAMAKRDMNRTALARALGTTNQNIHHLINRDKTNTDTLKTLAKVFEMPVSEFIALGED